MRPPLVSDEVCARTMLNRMYHAAYLETRQALRTHLGNPAFDVSHAALAGSLSGATDPDVRALGWRLDALRSAREDSDYKPRVNIPRAVAALHLVNARFILDNAGKLAGRFPRVRRR